MSYALEILRSAQKQLAHIDRHDQLRIITAIRSLADEPHPAGSKKLSGRDAWRIRVVHTASSMKFSMTGYSFWLSQSVIAGKSIVRR